MRVGQVHTKREKEIKYGAQGLFLMYGFPSLISIFMYVTGLEVLSNYIFVFHIIKYVCLLLMLFYFFANKDVKNVSVIGALFMIVLVMAVINLENIDMTIISSFVYFVAYTLVNIISISLLKDPNVILEKFRYIAYIGCIEVIAACVFGNILHIYDGNIDYMVLGNSGLIYTAVLLYWTIKEKRLHEIILSCSVIMCYVLFTSRGSLGALGGVVIYYIVFGDIGVSIKKRIKWIIGISITGMLLIKNFKPILESVASIANARGWNIGKLAQAALYFDSLFQSSSRVEIWEKAIDLIKQNWLIGYGPMSSPRLMHPASYVHNVELDMLLDFGVVLGGVFIVLIFTLLVLLLCTKKYRRWSCVCAALVLPGFLVLQLSGYWYSESYVFVLFFLFFLARKECKIGSGGSVTC